MNEIEIINVGEDFCRLISVLQNNYLYSAINNVLDIGAGLGTAIFKKHAKKYVALELDAELARKIEDKLKTLEGQHNVLNEDFFEFETLEKFDLILLNNFITVLPIVNVNKCFEKCFNLLNDGGILFVRANSNFHTDIKIAKDDPDVEEYQELKFRSKDESYYKNYFKLDELLSVITFNDFKISVIRIEDEEFTGQSMVKSEFLVFAMKTDD